MKFDIRHSGDHYELLVNGKFHSSHDTVTEAAKEIDQILEGKEDAA